MNISQLLIAVVILPVSALYCSAGDSELSVKRDNGLKMRMCRCPRGKFLMGSKLDELGREENEHQVEVSLTYDFWIGKYEVTQEEWYLVMWNSVEQQRRKPHTASQLQVDSGVGRRLPICHITVEEAVLFCERLTQREVDEGRLPEGFLYRLPSEAEWEYACRAGTSTATAFGESIDLSQAHISGRYGNEKFSTSQENPVVAVLQFSPGNQLVKVGKFPGNAWGICDMHGNVWEYCLDAYTDRVPGGTNPFVSDSVSIEQENLRTCVVRGGDWQVLTTSIRSAARVGYPASFRAPNLGFRVVLGPPLGVSP